MKERSRDFSDPRQTHSPLFISQTLLGASGDVPTKLRPLIICLHILLLPTFFPDERVAATPHRLLNAPRVALIISAALSMSGFFRGMGAAELTTRVDVCLISAVISSLFLLLCCFHEMR